MGQKSKILSFLFGVIEIRGIFAALHFMIGQDGCLLLAGIFYACKYAVYIIQRLFNPVLLLNGVATAYQGV